MQAMAKQDLVETGADACELRRQRKQVSELTIPAHEVQFLVEDGNALPDMIESGLQDADMGFAPADRVVAQGHFPDSPVERNRRRPVCARSERDRQYCRLQQ